MSRNRLRPSLRRMGVRLSGGGAGLTFLLRDDFTTAEAAPLASPRTCEPGGGTLTLVQTDGEFSISGGKLAFPAQATPAAGDLGFYGAGLSRTAGRSLLAQFNAATLETAELGWVNAGLARGYTQGWLLLGTGRIRPYMSGTSIDTGSNIIAAGTDYVVASVLRAGGVFNFIKGGAFTSWTLAWVDGAETSATLYPGFGNNSAVGTLDTFRVLDLPAPFSTDYGIATNRIAGAVSVGATFVHEANCLIEWTQTTLPVTGGASMQFRRQDSNNYWEITCRSDAGMRLVEWVDGVATTRGSVVSVLADGDRIVVIADSSTIRVYEANTLRITYASATNFSTETAGLYFASGGGGAVSDIVAWPRTLSGQAKTLLDAAIDA